MEFFLKLHSSIKEAFSNVCGNGSFNRLVDRLLYCVPYQYLIFLVEVECWRASKNTFAFLAVGDVYGDGEASMVAFVIVVRCVGHFFDKGKQGG